MDLVIGKNYLVEVWVLPPEACNGPEIRKEVLRFLGRQMGDGRVHTVRCGDVSMEMRADTEQELWEPPIGSSLGVGQHLWRIIPIRILEPDPIEDPVHAEIENY